MKLNIKNIFYKNLPLSVIRDKIYSELYRKVYWDSNTIYFNKTNSNTITVYDINAPNKIMEIKINKAIQDKVYYVYFHTLNSNQNLGTLLFKINWRNKFKIIK